MTVPKPVAKLLTARRLEQVPTDRPGAEVRLARAEEKLDAARKIASIDTEIAYVTAYDAMRIAVTAHMLAAGYRGPGIAGAHEAVGIYAEATIANPSTAEYQRIRWRRNKCVDRQREDGHGRTCRRYRGAQPAAVIRSVRATP